eukprot:TRINITY_DN2034_c0_g1_i1.p1 TRINITY_DN2034_c0_g1~~TRINITY_DN2034_c0_g1_i1.p1  ORF type:complete len:252 (+),score=18.54 TRINITY_DN2034_c0_g1_i1:58-813(+)
MKRLLFIVIFFYFTFADPTRSCIYDVDGQFYDLTELPELEFEVAEDLEYELEFCPTEPDCAGKTTVLYRENQDDTKTCLAFDESVQVAKATYLGTTGLQFSFNGEACNGSREETYKTVIYFLCSPQTLKPETFQLDIRGCHVHVVIASALACVGSNSDPNNHADQNSTNYWVVSGILLISLFTSFICVAIIRWSRAIRHNQQDYHQVELEKVEDLPIQEIDPSHFVNIQPGYLYPTLNAFRPSVYYVSGNQ